MTALMILGSLVGAAGLVAILRQKTNERKNEGPIQLGVSKKIRP